MLSVSLKSGRDKSVRLGHPWIFSGGIAGLPQGLTPGDIVRVLDAHKEFLAYAYCNPRSQITLRVLERDENVGVDEAWLHGRIAAAIAARRGPGGLAHPSCRLIFSESDLLPGLIADKFGEHVVLQTLTAGMERWKEAAAAAVAELTGCTGVSERNDSSVRALEGLAPLEGVLRGEPMPAEHSIVENGLRFLVSAGGQKTGYYLDQRINRLVAASHAGGREVLDCFSYTGSFAVHCLQAGAKSVLRLDSSADALAVGEQNLALNGFDPADSPSRQGNAFEELRRFRDANRSFDLIILDPPKLAPTRSQAEKAMRAYKDINLFAMKLLVPNGILITFSCSSGVNAADFRTTVAWAAADAGREAQVIGRLGPPEDHPVLLSFPEGEYLKGLVLRVL
jgi:23S rRNA (cytosine1962-C5)-methyltransferase